MSAPHDTRKALVLELLHRIEPWIGTARLALKQGNLDDATARLDSLNDEIERFTAELGAEMPKRKRGPR